MRARGEREPIRQHALGWWAAGVAGQQQARVLCLVQGQDKMNTDSGQKEEGEKKEERMHEQRAAKTAMATVLMTTTARTRTPVLGDCAADTPDAFFLLFGDHTSLRLPRNLPT